MRVRARPARACSLLLHEHVKVAVIVNAGAGSVGTEACDERVREIRDAFAAAGVASEVYLCEAAQLTATARRLATQAVDVVVAAGGDGTVSAVATGLVRSGVPLGVLPLGTLNHFAKDLDMPTADLAAAARAIRDGVPAAVDVGEVNGHIFINNSSIGLYPEAVMHRDVERKRAGRGKWVAMLLAVARVLRRFRRLAVVVATPDRTVVARTPFVFFGNNPYETHARALGERPQLDTGKLALYTMRARGRVHMFYLIARALAGKADALPAFEIAHVTEATVRLRHRRLTVALDGEVRRMSSPLRYRVHPGALTVIRPPLVAVEPIVDQPPAAALITPVAAGAGGPR